MIWESNNARLALLELLSRGSLKCRAARPQIKETGMTMKLTHLRTHWDADDAWCVIAFLDELRDALWEVYGADIIEAQHAVHLESRQTKLPFDDDIEF